MSSMRSRLSAASEAFATVVLTFWVGALWTIGYLVAPVLFSALADRHLAGQIAGQLFHLMGWAGIGCSAYLGLFLFRRSRLAVLKRRVLWLLAAMAALTAIGLFGIQPLLAQMKLQVFPLDVMESVLRDRFAVWHGISSVLYLLQSLLGAVLIVSAGRGGFK